MTKIEGYPGEASRVRAMELALPLSQEQLGGRKDRDELMNLMNLFWDSADVICICRGGVLRPATKQSIKPATGGSKFISSFKKLFGTFFKSKSVFLLIKRLKKYEFMNINELIWGLFPSFAMERMNMHFLNELRVLQVHSKFIEIHKKNLFNHEKHEISERKSKETKPRNTRKTLKEKQKNLTTKYTKSTKRRSSKKGAMDEG